MQVGGLPTRFKYVPVEGQNFALSPAEILMATDQELNQYMSVKKYAPYRQGQPKWDKNRGERLKELKQKVGERMDGSAKRALDVAAADAGADKKKRKGKKERMKAKEVGAASAPVDLAEKEADGSVPLQSKRKREEGDILREDGHAGKKKRRHRKAAAE